jgi:thiol peroxidase
MEQRKGIVTKDGKPVTLIGPEVKVGQKAPDFKLVDTNWNEVELSRSKGRVRLLSVVYSLDTPVCDLQTQRFEEEAGKFRDAVFYTISMDLPFAQARYFENYKVKNMTPVSDYKYASFGKAYGVFIKELHLLSRAIFIIDDKDIIRYVEYVGEVGNLPDYGKATAALKNLVPIKVG